jgi:hypothetical protein
MSREDEEVGVCDAGGPSPLNTYIPTSRGKSGYSDWVIQCANEIYPIVGISYVGHKLQLLGLLTFLEEECWNNVMVTNSNSGTKGKREVRNLECLVNYDARSVRSRCGNRKGRGHVIIL